ncbi:MAG: SpoIIE family protein phosphatase [Kiritimatiellae bacterium]|nr:SpoIIE family protein phosphatase [Kiritimatiellia bacterium]
MSNEDEIQQSQTTMRIDISPDMLQQLQQFPADAPRRPVRAAPRTPSAASPAPPVTIRIPQAPIRPLGGEDFQTLLQNIYDAFFLTDMTGRVLGANPRAEQFFLSNRADLCKSNILDWFCGAENDVSLLQTIALTLENNRFVLLQAVCRRTDGSTFPSEISTCRLPLGGRPHLGFFLRDITIRKENEERLRIGNNALQNAAGGIAVTSTEGLFSTYVNPAMRQLLGFAPEDDPARYSIRQFIADPAEADAMFAAVLEGRDWEGVVAMRKKDGSPWYAQAALAADVTPEGYLSGVVVSLLDVTRERQAQEQLRVRNAEMAADLRMARDLQIAFLPSEYPDVAVPGKGRLEFAHLYRPSGLVGGDFFSVLPLDGRKAIVFIADVMGHGARAALVVATLRGLLESVVKTTQDPGQFLTRLNAAYSRIFASAGELMFATACCARFDLEAGEIRVANAGHPPAMVVDADGVREGCLAEEAIGPAVGLLDGATYGSCTWPWKPGDRLVFYTDGLTEAHVGAMGEEFGEDRLRDALAAARGLPPDGMVAAAVAAAEKHVEGAPFEDDVCVLSVGYAPEGAPTVAAAPAQAADA